MNKFSFLIIMIFCLFCTVGCSLNSHRIQITSEPTGAEIFLQNDLIGETPFETTIEQQAGDFNVYILRAEKDDYLPNQKIFKEQFFGDTVVDVVPQKIHFVMVKKKEHPIHITSYPSGATLILNGKVLGETPVTVTIMENTGAARVFTFIAEINGFKSKKEVLKEFVPVGNETPFVFPKAIHFEF